MLSFPFAALLFLAAFLGYASYTLQTENLRLKSELERLSNSYDTLEAEHTELQSKYEELFENYNFLNQSLYALMQDFRELSADYEDVLTRYSNLSVDYALLSQEHFFLLQNYTALSEKYGDVLADYIELTVAYEVLSQNYNELLENYMRLKEEAAGYTTLLNEYQELTQAYQSLLANYTQVKEKYDALYTALYKPLLAGDKIVPTTQELRQWLKEDKTDEIVYREPDFVCGDYAVMLHMHAKMKGWDMGVVAVLGKLGGRPFNHVFNAIICKEGLAYVEPQNDEVFYGPITETYYHPGFGMVQVNEFVVVVLYNGG